MKAVAVLVSSALSFSVMAGTQYSCSGTEPNWNLQISEGNITFTLPNNSKINEQVAARVKALNVDEDYAFIVRTHKGSVANIVSGACSDGMTDNLSTKHIIFVTGDTVLNGCCDIVK